MNSSQVKRIVTKPAGKKVLAILNPKGGTGKTTIAFNLAYSLSTIAKYNVLLIDLNPLGHLSRLFTGEWNDKIFRISDCFVKNILTDNIPSIIDNCIISARETSTSLYYHTEMYLIPSSFDLIKVELKCMKENSNINVYYLRKFLAKFGVKYERKESENSEKYIGVGAEIGAPQSTSFLPDNDAPRRESAIPAPFDFVIIDTPPSCGLLTLMAVISAHTIIIPISPEFFTLSSVMNLFSFLRSASHKINIPPPSCGLLANKFDERLKAHRQNLNSLQGVFPVSLLYRTIIPFTIKLEEANMKMLPIALYMPGSTADEAFHSFTLELLERENLIKTVADEQLHYGTVIVN